MGKARAALAAILVCTADAASKAWTHAHLPVLNGDMLWYPYGGIGVFENFYGIEFSITHAVNHGAAWSLFAEQQAYLMAFRIVFVSLLLAYTCFYNKNRAWDMPLALITAGALSNIADYFIYGHVVDMFHVVLWGYDYPVFNIADSAICIGMAWLLLLSFWGEKEKGKKRA